MYIRTMIFAINTLTAFRFMIYFGSLRIQNAVIVPIVTFTETFANGHYFLIDFSMEYQGSNPNVDHYPGQKTQK